jgi:hypothetical protein
LVGPIPGPDKIPIHIEDWHETRFNQYSVVIPAQTWLRGKCLLFVHH